MKDPASGATVTAAMIKGRIRMWHYVDGNWNGQKAAYMYKGILQCGIVASSPESLYELFISEEMGCSNRSTHMLNRPHIQIKVILLTCWFANEMHSYNS